MVAAPQPPSLKLPEPVTDLAARRAGNQVDLHWTMPRRTTDKVLLVGDQKVKVCRRTDSGPCKVAGSLLLAPQASAVFTDHLPPALASGTPGPLLYTIELDNRYGRTAGPSNTAVTASGVAPSPIADLHAKAQADGILLSWSADGGNETVRIHRKLVQPSTSQKTAIPPEQTLEFSGRDQGQVLDPDAALDHTYTYTAERIAQLTIEGKPVEVASEPSQATTVNARDIFPPAVPAGLQAVADSEAHAIDLSWQPDTEPDLAGYTVYRREAGSTAPPARISPPSQPAPSFRDATAAPGHTYEYSVSAVDHDGNESVRSPEVEETLPEQ
jgi:hypothetical protein